MEIQFVISAEPAPPANPLPDIGASPIRLPVPSGAFRLLPPRDCAQSAEASRPGPAIRMFASPGPFKIIEPHFPPIPIIPTVFPQVVCRFPPCGLTPGNFPHVSDIAGKAPRDPVPCDSRNHPGGGSPTSNRPVWNRPRSRGCDPSILELVDMREIIRKWA